MAADAVQDWPDIPVTPLPAPVDNEIESDDTAHALPVIPKSAVASQPAGGDRQEEHQLPTTGVHEVAGEELDQVQPYIPEEDEATVIVRMTDVQAAYKAMEALESESGVQRQEPLEGSLPSTEDWSPEEIAVPVLETREQVEAVVVGSEEKQPASMESEREIEPAVAEGQWVDVQTESEAEPEVEEEQRPGSIGVEEVADATVVEEQQEEDGVGESKEEQEQPTSEVSAEISSVPIADRPFEEKLVADWPEMELPEVASEEPSQASQQVDKAFVARQQTRQRNSSRRSKSKR